MKRRLRGLWLLGLILLAFVLGLLGGVLLDRQVLCTVAPPGGIPAEAIADFRLMAEAWNVIQQAYVDQVALQQRRLAYGAIRGRISHCLLTTYRRINRAAAGGSAVGYA